MIVWTVRLATSPLTTAAELDLVVKWVVLSFLPAVSSFTTILTLATIDCIVLNKGLHLPALAMLSIIFIELWLPSVVLPVVGIYALVSSVMHVTVGTPDSLEVKHIEVHIPLFHSV